MKFNELLGFEECETGDFGTTSYCFKIYKSDLRDGAYYNLKLKFSDYLKDYLIKNNFDKCKFYSNKKLGQCAFVFSNKFDVDKNIIKIRFDKTRNECTLQNKNITNALLKLFDCDSVKSFPAPIMLKGLDPVTQGNEHLIIFK